MRNRSWLLVPGDSDKKLGMALTSGADAVVVDIAGYTDPVDKALARRRAAEWLAVHRRQVTESRRFARWVRIAPIDDPAWREDMIVAMRGGADGVVLTRAAGMETVRHLAAELYELEEAHQIATGSTQIMAVVGETAQSALTMAGYLDAATPRLTALGWNAASTTAAAGARRQRDEQGGWSDPCRMVRAQLLLAAHARGIDAVETAHGEPPHGEKADGKTLGKLAGAARADGFTGMFALHPAQVPALNTTFAPDEDDKAAAREVLAAQEAAQAGNGLPVDPLRLRAARRVLGQAEPQAPASAPARMPILRLA